MPNDNTPKRCDQCRWGQPVETWDLLGNNDAGAVCHYDTKKQTNHADYWCRHWEGKGQPEACGDMQPGDILWHAGLHRVAECTAGNGGQLHHVWIGGSAQPYNVPMDVFEVIKRP